MSIWKAARQGSKPSGGRFRPYRKKRAYEIGQDPINPKIAEKTVTRKKRLRGGSEITQVLTASHANLMLENGKFKKSKIKTVKENPSNRHFVRMNVITRGAIIETEDGLAKVTSRPTRDGIVNAVLVKAK